MRGSRGLISLGITTIIVLSTISFITTTRVDASPGTIYVGGSGSGNYSSIQSAIDDANDGDTVFVYSGTYYEHINVNLAINLIGEDKNTTIIDGGGIGAIVDVAGAAILFLL